jgi:hypothetical protein
MICSKIWNLPRFCRCITRPALPKEISRVSSISFSSNILSQIAGSSSTANQFVTDLNQLAQDLQSGNLSAAQQDFVTLSKDVQDGATSATATTSSSGITTSLLSDIASSPSGSTSFANELNQLGTDLSSGNLNSAQGDMLSLDTMALSANGETTASKTSSSNLADTAALIKAIVSALGTGDTSAAGSALSELASVSTSTQGAGDLANFASSLDTSSGSSSSNPLINLLSNLNSGSSSSTSSLLSEQA